MKALLAHSACVRGVAVDAQGFLATGALDNVVRLWDGKGQLVHELRGHEKPAMADGGVLAVALDGEWRAGSVRWSRWTTLGFFERRVGGELLRRPRRAD